MPRDRIKGSRFFYPCLEYELGLLEGAGPRIHLPTGLRPAVGAFRGAFLLTPFHEGLGTVMGALFGSYGGLFLVEIIRERNLKPSARAGPKALLGGVTGSLAKGVFALIMVIIALSAIYS